MILINNPVSVKITLKILVSYSVNGLSTHIMVLFCFTLDMHQVNYKTLNNNVPEMFIGAKNIGRVSR